MWWTVAGAQAAAALVLLWRAWISAGDVPRWLLIPISAVAVIVAAGLPPIRFRRWRYEIRERDVLLSRGALFLVLTLIPFDRIQFAEIRQGPLDRLFRLNQLILYTAAGRAGRIPGLDPSEAEALREEVSKVAGRPTV